MSTVIPPCAAVNRREFVAACTAAVISPSLVGSDSVGNVPSPPKATGAGQQFMVFMATIPDGWEPKTARDVPPEYAVGHLWTDEPVSLAEAEAEAFGFNEHLLNMGPGFMYWNVIQPANPRMMARYRNLRDGMESDDLGGCSVFVELGDDGKDVYVKFSPHRELYVLARSTNTKTIMRDLARQVRRWADELEGLE